LTNGESRKSSTKDKKSGMDSGNQRKGRQGKYIFSSEKGHFDGTPLENKVRSSRTIEGKGLNREKDGKTYHRNGDPEKRNLVSGFLWISQSGDGTE
jgi:hypothetical protein